MVLGTSELIEEIEKNKIVDIYSKNSIQGSSIDLRMGEKARVQVKECVIDLSKEKEVEEAYEEVDLAKGYKLKPGEFLYTNTIEYVKIPNNMCALLLPRSSFSRIGLMLPISQYANPGYEGYLPIIVFNASKSTVIIPPYYRIMQMVLCRVSGETKAYGEQVDAKYFQEGKLKDPSFNDSDIEDILKKLQ